MRNHVPLSFYTDVYPRVRSALDDDRRIDAAEAEELVALAQQVDPAHAAPTRNQLTALRNTSDDPAVRAVLDAYLSGQDSFSARPSPRRSPGGARATPTPATTPSTPGATSAIALRAFPPGLVPYGRTTAVPPFLAEMKVDEVVHDFGAGNGLNGTGVHLGEGLVLSAAHVIMPFLGTFSRSSAPFAGDKVYDYSWRLTFVPELGSYSGTRRPTFLASDAGSWNDFAVVRTDEKSTHDAVRGVRPTGDLAPGERVWIVGDKTGASTRVSVGRFDRIDGNNAVISDTAVEGGFSGSPVLDDQGRLCGVACVKLGSGDLYIVTTEAIAEQLRTHAPDSDAARFFREID